jgi:hypothetical protein
LPSPTAGDGGPSPRNPRYFNDCAKVSFSSVSPVPSNLMNTNGQSSLLRGSSTGILHGQLRTWPKCAAVAHDAKPHHQNETDAESILTRVRVYSSSHAHRRKFGWVTIVSVQHGQRRRRPAPRIHQRRT